MVPTDSGAVVTHDKVKAVVLSYLYDQPDHRAHWRDIFDEVKHIFPAGTMPVDFLLPWSPLDALEQEGRVIRRSGAWYRLTASQWLSMARLEQQCLTTSTSSQ